MKLQATPSQTVGPYFTIGLTRLSKVDLVGPGVSGEKVTIAGGVLDGDGKPVPDALLEIWQANSHGKYAHHEDNQNKALELGFQGYGRMGVDASGRFLFTTVKPGVVPGPNGTMQAPHIAVSVFARGLLLRLVTRISIAEGGCPRDLTPSWLKGEASNGLPLVFVRGPRRVPDMTPSLQEKRRTGSKGLD